AALRGRGRLGGRRVPALLRSVAPGRIARPAHRADRSRLEVRGGRPPSNARAQPCGRDTQTARLARRRRVGVAVWAPPSPGFAGYSPDLAGGGAHPTAAPRKQPTLPETT